MHKIKYFLLLFVFFSQMTNAQDTIPVAYDEDILIYENGVYTFFDTSGQAITPRFKTPPCFFPLRIDANLCYLSIHQEFEAQIDGKWGMMTRGGQVIVPFEYDEIMETYEGRTFVRERKKWFEIERSDKEIKNNKKLKVDCDFVSVDYRLGVFFVKGDRIIFSPETGEVADTAKREPEYDYFQIKRGCDYGAGNANGELILPLIYKNIDISGEGIAVSDGNKWGFYYPKNQEITAIKYDDITVGTNDGLLVYTIDGKKGLMRISGKELTEPVYQRIYAFGDSLNQVKRDGKWGFINRNGEEIIPCIYEDIDGFKNGLASAKQDGKWGFINSKGEVEISFQFAGGPNGLFFREYEKAKIKEGGTCYYIDRKGEIIEECSCR